MGLQINNYIYKGIPLQNAYIKVVHIDGNKNKLYFNFEIYASKEIADADISNQNYLEISGMFNIVPDLNSNDNFIKQMYEYLKNLPAFQDAVDC